MLPEESNITRDKIDLICATIQDLYTADDRPWIIGFSGGKDSTTVLHLIWMALSQLSLSKLKKKIYCISSDTYVEMPLIEKYLHSKIDHLNRSAALSEIPIEAYTVTPDVDETFWVNLIGRGYPAPYRNFRWCTDRMKIKPTSRFIKDKIAVHGDVVIALGVRRDESSARASSMQAERTTEDGKKIGRKIISKYVSQHKDLPSASVFSPIEDWTTEEVWEFLDKHDAPWGGDHSELKILYRNAQKADDDGEDELAEKTFGNSRFGCWTCTVVQNDISMEATVLKEGNAWMMPLLKFRDWLTTTQDPEKKGDIREFRRRTGNVQTWTDADGKKSIIWGPYTFQFRKIILRKLLQAQTQARLLKGDLELELIRRDELLAIRQLWRCEEGDWGDSFKQIYKDEVGVDLDAPRDDWSGMGVTEHNILRDVCEKHELPVGLLTDLFAMEQRYNGMSRRSKIFDNVHSILKKDWRTRDEVFAEIARQNSEQQTGIGDLVHAAEKNNS
ncbi:DNA phosphorothioation system sulfurtransferase DndC [Desulfovibrio ferrophilus]|uniref:Phosphoadenosine phosphosulfate reductase n=1 Tax=Desulfovibrio ferrophilus TaxID=241368 RepID=A0A2Z6AZ04_9BACT|nr:DNA phosphorothioation system sulfurtransferase DndC [Desulfovibrio ferrophilus]BBD08438.1 phosphoadenosine phosphosulfate reductase [Desulfovibrio ferrophilus]